MKKRSKREVPNKFILMIVIFVCAGAIVMTTAMNAGYGPFAYVADVIFVPMQNGINKISRSILSFTEEFSSKEALLAENKELKEQVEELTQENNTLVLETYELANLQELYELDAQYSDYEKVGAYVIAKDSGNWFSTFTINKGSADGIEVDMNVIADGGLVGIVTSVGKHYATVRTIIDDSSNVSAMVLTTSDNFILAGSLTQMDTDQTLPFSQLQDTDDAVATGDAVVTSYISEKYLPGLLIGYITTIETNSNKLTKSGTITPVVDFAHLQEVLVILETKETGE